MNVMKEREIDALATLWVNAHVAYLLVVQWATATEVDGSVEESDPSSYDDIITTKEARTIDAFSSWVIHASWWRQLTWGKGLT